MSLHYFHGSIAHKNGRSFNPRSGQFFIECHESTELLNGAAELRFARITVTVNWALKTIVVPVQLWHALRMISCTRVHKTCCCLLPESQVKAKCLLWLRSSSHSQSLSLSLRSAADTRIFRIPRMGRRTLEERSFQYIGPVIWNSPPLSVRQSSSLFSFNSKLKTHLFSSAS